jgi:hypothetical protein
LRESPSENPNGISPSSPRLRGTSYLGSIVQTAHNPSGVASTGGQKEHHRKMTFQDELRALLRKDEIEFDERYVWG